MRYCFYRSAFTYVAKNRFSADIFCNSNADHRCSDYAPILLNVTRLIAICWRYWTNYAQVPHTTTLEKYLTIPLRYTTFKLSTHQIIRLVDVSHKINFTNKECTRQQHTCRIFSHYYRWWWKGWGDDACVCTQRGSHPARWSFLCEDGDQAAPPSWGKSVFL